MQCGEFASRHRNIFASVRPKYYTKIGCCLFFSEWNFKRIALLLAFPCNFINYPLPNLAEHETHLGQCFSKHCLHIINFVVGKTDGKDCWRNENQIKWGFECERKLKHFTSVRSMHGWFEFTFFPTVYSIIFFQWLWLFSCLRFRTQSQSTHSWCWKSSFAALHDEIIEKTCM